MNVDCCLLFGNIECSMGLARCWFGNLGSVRVLELLHEIIVGFVVKYVRFLERLSGLCGWTRLLGVTDGNEGLAIR